MLWSRLTPRRCCSGCLSLDDLRGLFQELSLSEQSLPIQDEDDVEIITETGDMEFLDALIGYELHKDIPLGTSPLAAFRSSHGGISVTDLIGLAW